MLKRRIIPVELLSGERLVKSVRFEAFRDVGDPLKSSQVYGDQDADELVFLNINRQQRNTADTERHLRGIAKTCFMPIAAGGGVRHIEDAARLFNAGADKVVVNSAAYADRALLEEIARRYGNQALVVSVDVRARADGDYTLHSDCGREAETAQLEPHIAMAVAAGAGEIFLNSIDQDGVMQGYDMALVRRVRAVCLVPLIVCGGAGHYLHLQEALEAGVDAVACGSLFNFGDNNPLRVKAFLKNQNVPLKRI